MIDSASTASSLVPHVAMSSVDAGLASSAKQPACAKTTLRSSSGRSKCARAVLDALSCDQLRHAGAGSLALSQQFEHALWALGGVGSIEAAWTGERVGKLSRDVCKLEDTVKMQPQLPQLRARPWTATQPRSSIAQASSSQMKHRVSAPNGSRPVGPRSQPVASTSAKCVSPSCFSVPPGKFSFLHIPKTAGSSFEVSGAALGIEILLAPGVRRLPLQKVPGGSAWHLPPDMFRLKHKVDRSPNGREIMCVVRNPADRLRSEFAWRCSDGNRQFLNMTRACAQPRGAEAEMTAEAETVLRSQGRVPLLGSNDRILHMMPQSWFVWAEDGHVQCQCVVSRPVLQEWPPRAHACPHHVRTPVLRNPHKHAGCLSKARTRQGPQPQERALPYRGGVAAEPGISRAVRRRRGALR